MTAQPADLDCFLKNIDDLENSVRVTSLAASAVDDVGSDVASVQALRREHDDLASELDALGKRVGSTTVYAEKMMARFPDQELEIIDRQAELNKAWQAALQQMAVRKRKLSDAFDYQRFLTDYRELSAWIDRMMTADEYELANEAEEIDVRQSAFNHFFIFGQLLLESNHFASQDIKKCLADLSASYRNLQNYLVKGKYIM